MITNKQKFREETIAYWWSKNNLELPWFFEKDKDTLQKAIVIYYYTC